MSLILLGLIGALLFALAFVTKRRFGLLVLGLCAGIVLSNVLSRASADVLTSLNISVASLNTETLATALLVVLPSLILMVGGPRYQKAHTAIIGGLLYAVSAVVLLLTPLQSALVLDTASRQIVDTVLSYQSMIVAVIIILALFDTMGAKTPKLGKKH